MSSATDFAPSTVTSRFMLPDGFIHHAACALHHSVDVPAFLQQSPDQQLELMRDWDVAMLCGLGTFSPIARPIAFEGLSQARDSWLHNWVPPADASTFWKAMASANAVATGAAVVYFALPREDHIRRAAPEILDILCPVSGFEGLCSFIENRLYGQRCTLAECDILPSSKDRFQPDGAIQFRQYMRTPQGLLHICTPVDGRSSLFPITQSLDTHTFNYVSANTICLGYPTCFITKHTLRRPPLIGPSEVHDPSRQGLALYQSWGFVFHDSVGAWLPDRPSNHMCKDDGFCCSASRYFGDKHCVTLSFATEVETFPPRMFGGPTEADLDDISPVIPIWSTAWKFGGKACGDESCFVDITPGSVDILIVP